MCTVPQCNSVRYCCVTDCCALSHSEAKILCSRALNYFAVYYTNCASLCELQCCQLFQGVLYDVCCMCTKVLCTVQSVTKCHNVMYQRVMYCTKVYRSVLPRRVLYRRCVLPLPAVCPSFFPTLAHRTMLRTISTEAGIKSNCEDQNKVQL